MERRKEIEKLLIWLMDSLEMPAVRMMLTFAIIRAHHLHEEMARWIASYYNSDRDITAQAFMSKLNELTDEENF